MQTVNVTKSKLKPKVFEYIRSVQAGNIEVCITDRGKPVAKIISMHSDDERELELMRGLVLEYTKPCDPADTEWDVLK